MYYMSHGLTALVCRIGLIVLCGAEPPAAAQTVGVRVVALSATFNLLDENKLRLADNFRRLKVLAQGATILATDLLTLCSGTRNQQDMWTLSSREPKFCSVARNDRCDAAGPGGRDRI